MYFRITIPSLQDGKKDEAISFVKERVMTEFDNTPGLLSMTAAITGETSGATLTPSSTTETVTLANNNTLSLTTGYANPELQPDSGQIVYLENRKPISRASDQTEDIKLIIEF